MPNLQLEALIDLSRVNKFAGTMVLFWPYAWSVTMSARQFVVPANTYLLALLEGFLGACLLHRSQFVFMKTPEHTPLIVMLCFLVGGGCIWNDIIDRHIDAKVERTKNRPLPSGRVTVPEALLFLFAHLVVMISMLYPLKRTAWFLGLLAIGPLPGIYPFTKRVTYWPQAWLGLALNIGVLFGSAIFTGEISRESVALAAGGWSWTMWYDTIYGCQDKKDDVKAGVKSTALLFNTYTKPILFVFGSLLVGSWLYCGIYNGSGVWYFVITVVGGTLLLLRQMWHVDLDAPESCWQTFQNNGFLLGPVVWIGFLGDYLMS